MKSSRNGARKHHIGHLTKNIDDASGEIIINNEVDNINDSNKGCNERNERYVIDGKENRKNVSSITLKNNYLISNVSSDELKDEAENTFQVRE